MAAITEVRARENAREDPSFSSIRPMAVSRTGGRRPDARKRERSARRGLPAAVRLFPRKLDEVDRFVTPCVGPDVAGELVEREVVEGAARPARCRRYYRTQRGGGCETGSAWLPGGPAFRSNRPRSQLKPVTRGQMPVATGLIFLVKTRQGRSGHVLPGS
jgi:hypothetical protein